MKIVYSPQHHKHSTHQVLVKGQPFDIEDVPERADLILSALQQAGLGEILPPQDFGLEPILAVHDQGYVQFLQTIFQAHQAYTQTSEPVLPQTFSSRRPARKPRNLLWLPGYYSYATGTPILEGTWQAAYHSAQVALTAAHWVASGDPVSYGLCRPPGHHAGYDYYGGYCFLNNAAIAARFLGQRTAILDIDYHHGNGTQDIFYTDPDVLYVSLHADPEADYPYFWGGAGERGEAAGLGTNFNFPLPLKAGEEQYIQALEMAMEEIQKFRAHYLVVSLGLDLCSGDPVGDLNISFDGLKAIARLIHSQQIPTVIIQEGGYLLESLGLQVTTFLREFVDD